MNMTPLEAALWYASLGYSVFCCQPDTKIPYGGTNGSKDATTNVDKIKQWWIAKPKANVAIATGSVSDLYVVDVDNPTSEVLALLAPTLMSRTPSGGWHFVYAANGRELKNTNKKSDNAVHPDCDTRGDGGYIVVYPSTVAGKPYTWVDPNIAPVPVPDWIVDRVSRKQQALGPATYRTAASAWAQAALDQEISQVALTSEGGRNERLNRAAFSLGQIVAAGHLSPAVVEGSLLQAALRCGLGQSESIKTIASGLRGGAASPRSPVENRPQHRQIDEPQICEDDEDPIEEIVTDEEDRSRWELLQQIRELGGLCDSFSAWVVRGADYAQPGLTIGALLALGSVLGGRRLVYRSNLTALYICSVANSGEGKNRPKTCLERVLGDHWPASIGPSSFSSAPSFVDAVKTATYAGCGMVLALDEYGMQLASMIGPKAAQHRQDLKAILTELATKGPYTWTPSVSLARGGGKLSLHAPCVAIHGSTTPESVHEILTSTDLADGFVGRHLWVFAQDHLPISRPTKERGEDQIPEEVVTAIETLRERHMSWHMDAPIKNMNEIDQIRLYLPISITETEEAGDRIEAYRQECDHHTRAGGRPELVRSALRRAAEYAARVSGVLAVLSQPEAEVPQVTLRIVEAAIAVVEASNSGFSESLRENARPRNSDYQGKLQYFLGKIPKEGITRRDLLRSARQLPTRDLAEIMQRLEESGEIQFSQVQGKKGPAKTIVLRTQIGLRSKS